MRRSVAIGAGILVAIGAVVLVVVLAGRGHRTRGNAAGSTSVAATSTTGTTTQAGTGHGPGTGTTTQPSTTTKPTPGPSPQRGSGRKLLVGVVEISTVIQPDANLALQEVKRVADSGFGALLIQATWIAGEMTAQPDELAIVQRGVDAADRNGLRVFLALSQGRSKTVPTTPAARSAFAGYAASLARALPSVRDWVIGNEPNLNTFWLPQFGSGGSDAAAQAYEALLAQTYDALKAVSPRNRVIGGALAPRGSDNPALSRPTHSPTGFIRDLGAAYRASKRNKPLMDAFALHPYAKQSRVSPLAAHPRDSTITLADYPKLVGLLEEAFGGTTQPGRSLPIYYTEFGVQTTIPSSERRFYLDLSSPEANDTVSATTQGDYYRQALAAAYCQPTVHAFFIFHTIDEPDLRGWQSGLYYFDRRPKASLGVVKRAAAGVRSGRIAHCSVR